jgi:hypothetical protein
MALYWPDKKVALDIIDDPHRRPFEGDESYTVLRVTCADLCDYESFRKITNKLCDLLDQELPDIPGCVERSHELYEMLSQSLSDEVVDAPLPSPFATSNLSNVQVIASSKAEAKRMREATRQAGQYVRGISVWEGPVPSGSFEVVSGNMRMSTPEYFFLRKANELSLPEAVRMGMELCGKYRTVITQYDRGSDYDFIRVPRTTKARIRSYLRGARGTKEGKRAKRVLRLIEDECCSPMSSYLFELLCLTRAQGGYGLERGMPSSAFAGDNGFMPSSSGMFLAYDVCWPDKHVAVQYVGKRLPGERHIEALNAQGVRTVCVTDAEIADPELFDLVAHSISSLLEVPLPEETELWRSQRDQLRKLVPPPTFKHMRLTMDDISEHRSE